MRHHHPNPHLLNPLLGCCEALFARIAPLTDKDRATPLASDFHEQIVGEFMAMEKRALDLQISMVEFKDAKYALAAFVDELVLNSSWSGREQWMQLPLQLEFFGEHTAGEGFYERLATLRQGGDDNIDLLELYYYCLQLGFEGLYKIKGLEHLMALQVDLRSQIDSCRGPVEPLLAPPGLPGHALINRVRRQVPYWVIWVITVACVFFTYLGYSVVADNLAESNISAIMKRQTIITSADPLHF